MVKRAAYAPVTLEFVRSRCVEECDCWLWQGAVNSQACPVIGWRDADGHKRTSNVRRLVAGMLGMDLSGGRVATCSCCDPRCVSPKHAKAVTRSEMQMQWAAVLGYHANPVRRARLSAAARARSPHSDETIAQVHALAETMTQREVARRLGLNFDFVNKIVRGRLRYVVGCNPFAGLGARPARRVA